jgi:hypothetical protein
VARFLSQEWARQYNETLAGTMGPAPDPDAGLAAADGRFTVAQEVRGTPDGDVRLLVVADAGELRFEVGPLDGADHRPDVGGDGAEGAADVTIVVSYADAAAMSRGELTPAEALNGGRIRVRGDLSVLVAGQRLVEDARRRVEALAEVTTY